jgi:hypothetical protein
MFADMLVVKYRSAFRMVCPFSTATAPSEHARDKRLTGLMTAEGRHILPLADDKRQSVLQSALALSQSNAPCNAIPCWTVGWLHNGCNTQTQTSQ